MPCLLINADGEDSSVIALVENLQRRDLDFFEEANGFKRLIEQFGLTQEEAARKVEERPSQPLRTSCGCCGCRNRIWS